MTQRRFSPLVSLHAPFKLPTRRRSNFAKHRSRRCFSAPRGCKERSPEPLDSPSAHRNGARWMFSVLRAVPFLKGAPITVSGERKDERQTFSGFFCFVFLLWLKSQKLKGSENSLQARTIPEKVTLGSSFVRSVFFFVISGSAQHPLSTPGAFRFTLRLFPSR